MLVVAALVVVCPNLETTSTGGEPTAARAYVVRAIDGDTIEVRFGGREEEVRYIGVDTPETVKPGTPVQCFGPQASRLEHQLVEHRWVRLELRASRQGRGLWGACPP